VKSLLLSKLNNTERLSSSHLEHFTYTHRHSDETGYGGEFPEIILICWLWLTQLYDVTLHVAHNRIAGNPHTMPKTERTSSHPTLAAISGVRHYTVLGKHLIEHFSRSWREITWRTIVELLHTMR